MEKLHHKKHKKFAAGFGSINLEMRAILSGNGNVAFAEVEKPAILPSQCLIKVHFAGINRADLLQIKGLYPPPSGETDILGLEFSGEIVETGANVTGFKPGDRVCSIVGSGAFAEFLAVEHEHLIKVPENMNLSDAGAIPEAFITAYQSLIKLAKLQEGERILIHAGASGVGAAAIQVAKKVDAKVIVTASRAKHPFCRDLGADQCIDYKSVSFDEAVSNVDVVLDLIGGSYFGKNINVLGIEGRMIMLGFLGGVKAESTNVAGIVVKRLRIEGSTLRARSKSYKTNLIQSFIADFMVDGTFDLHANVDQIFDWEDYTKAHTFMTENQNKGKILLKIT